MRGLALLLGLTPLLVLELVLRLSDAGISEAVDHDPLVNMDQLQPLFVRTDSDGDWEIPEHRLNFFRPASFPATKSPGTKRVFVLGGSTVQGRPYATETAFSTWLQLWMQAADPDTNFEVVNCGGVSYASYRVAKILNEVLGHQPDAIVLYTGHNEFLEDRTYAEARSLGVIRRTASRIGSKLRTVRWLRERLVSPPAAPTELSAEVDAMLDHQGGLDGYRRDVDWRAGVETHFAETLASMVAATRRAGVPLIVCVPTGDLVNTPPIKTTKRANLSTDDSSTFDQAWELATNKDLTPEARLNACATCLAIDPEHAGALYVRGRLHYERHDVTAATVALTAARDHDVCPLRATTAITDAVEELAGRESRSARETPNSSDLLLVATDKRFDRRDSRGAKKPDGIVDPELFVDHIHPSIAGHQILGEAIFEKLLTLGWFAPDLDPVVIRSGYESLAVAHLETLDQTYFARGKQRLAGLRRWVTGRAGEIGID